MYQRTVAAYREPDRKKGRAMMAALISTLSTGVPQALQEVITRLFMIDGVVGV